MSHPIRRSIPVPQWPSYKGTSQYVGTSPVATVTVYVDPSLGDPALQNAKELLADADRVVAANNAIFGVPGDPVSVIVYALGGQTDGTGGADHNACNYTDGGAIEVCASYGNAARVSALFEAELSECSMGGNLCGQTPARHFLVGVLSQSAITHSRTSRPHQRGHRGECPISLTKPIIPIKMRQAPVAVWCSYLGSRVWDFRSKKSRPRW